MEAGAVEQVEVEADEAAHGDQAADAGGPGGAAVALASDVQVVRAYVDRHRALGAGQVEGQGPLFAGQVHLQHGLDFQDIHRAQELGDERRGRALVEILRRADLFHLALVEDHHLVRHFEGFLLVVGDEQARHVHFVVQPAQPGAQLVAHLRVKSAEGLVEQEHSRLRSQGTSECHPLPLAAGKLRRIAVGVNLKLHQLEQLIHSLPDSLAWAACAPRGRRRCSDGWSYDGTERSAGIRSPRRGPGCADGWRLHR